MQIDLTFTVTLRLCYVIRTHSGLGLGGKVFALVSVLKVSGLEPFGLGLGVSLVMSGLVIIPERSHRLPTSLSKCSPRIKIDLFTCGRLNRTER